MTELTLVSHHTCPFVQRAAIALAEKRVPFERMNIDLSDKPDWFMALSPTGKVPVLRIAENGQTLGTVFESTAILEYLEETQPHPLHPADPLARADHRGWIVFAGALLSALTRLRTAKSAETFAHAGKQLAGVFAQLEERFDQRAVAQSAWFSGRDFCLVDATFAPAFRNYDIYARLARLDIIAGFPLTSAWASACRRRQSVRRAVPEDFEDRIVARVIGEDNHIARSLGHAGPKA